MVTNYVRSLLLNSKYVISCTDCHSYIIVTNKLRTDASYLVQYYCVVQNFNKTNIDELARIIKLCEVNMVISLYMMTKL